MKILSLNVWGGMLHAPLLAYLATVDADVYCLQEVVRAPDARGEWLTYRDGGVELQQRAHLHDEIAAVLPGHDGYFAPTSRGQLFDGDLPCWQSFGLATFVRKDWPIMEQAVGFVHGDFSADGFGAHPRPRNAHVLRILDPRSGQNLVVTHLHGLRDATGKHDTPARHAQAEALVSQIERIWRQGEPLVVCGDLNLLPDSATFSVLGRLGLRDLVTGGGHTDTRTSHYAKEGRFADYMLATPEVEIRSFEVVREPEVSDHRALLLETR